MVSLGSVKRLSTSGIKEIAAVLGGGIYAGSLVLIEGEAGTGKSVLSQHLTRDTLASLTNGVVYYTTEKTVKGLLTQMNSISLNVVDYYLTNRLQVYPIRIPTSFADNVKQLQRLLSHISSLHKRFNLVVLDSLTPLMRHSNPKTKIDFVHQCKELCQIERSIIIVANPFVIEEQLVPRLFSLTDYHLMLKSEQVLFDADKKEYRIVKILEVAKAHGVERQVAKRIRFEILPQVGIHIIPFNELRV